MEDDNLRGRAEGGSLLADSAEVLAQINRQHGQVHLVAWNNKRNLLFDQPLPVVRRHLRADIDQVRLLPGLEHVHVLAYRCRRLLLGVGVDDEKGAQSEQLRLRESVPFPEDGRQIGRLLSKAWSSPRRPMRREHSVRVHGIRDALASSVTMNMHDNIANVIVQIKCYIGKQRE